MDRRVIRVGMKVKIHRTPNGVVEYDPPIEGVVGELLDENRWVGVVVNDRQSIIFTDVLCLSAAEHNPANIHVDCAYCAAGVADEHERESEHDLLPEKTDDFYRIVGRKIGDSNWRLQMSITKELHPDGEWRTPLPGDEWITVLTNTFTECVNFLRVIEDY